MKNLITRNFAILVYLFFIPFLGLGQTYYVTTFAGSGLQGTANGLGAEASFSSPTSLKVDRSGNVYVSDDANHMIRKISPDGMVSTFVGSPNYGFRDGIGTNAQLSTPSGMAIDSSSSIYLCDYGNSRIRKISPTGTVTTIAGPMPRGRTDGNGINASFFGPTGIVIDASGNLLVSEYSNHDIRKIDLQNNVTTFAGSGSYGFRNGIGINAVFNAPRGLAIDTNGNLYLAEQGNNCIRKITPSGVVFTFAGSGARGRADGIGTAASFYSPADLAIDTHGNLFVTDTYNYLIRKITPAGVVTTLAGSGNFAFNDGIGANATFASANGIAIDANGDIYIGDTFNHRIRKMSVNPSGIFDHKLSNQLQVSPNPASGKVTLKTNGTGSIEILDLVGKVVPTQPATGTDVLNISELATGVYTVKVGSSIQKLVVR